MSDSSEPSPTRPSSDDKALIEALIAACIEAMEGGEADPATRVCSDRPDLLPRVRRRMAQLVSRGLVANADPTTPTTIGPYRIARELGSGGMGSVYLAEQLEPVRRLVALKVIKLGMDTREVVARFQAERQALALMSHPHIAQVFDAGITAEGRPFFAMEYVAGHGLLQFCDERHLPTIARVRLLATVCRAVQHAHDRGFIHRDLKPSNVLVTEHGGQFTPKVIDFGIAKAAANAALAENALQTRPDQVLGTPEYMSPEHARSGGLDVDTRADVYSLGVMLYELLCGELPFDSRRLRRAPHDELQRILADELPTLPSKRLSVVGEAALVARGGERISLQRSVAGDLDWITLKALAKQREQRYPSALALAEDLERWLANEPVLAAPPGHTYRLRKFVRRHRVAVGAAAAVLISLVVGLAVSLRATWQAEYARQQEVAARTDMRAFFDLARDAVGNLVDVANSDLAEVPQADAVRRRMLGDAIAFYEGLRGRRSQDLALRIDIANATHRIGVLQTSLGLVKDANATLGRAVAEVAALLREAPAEPRLHALAVESRNAWSAALQAGGQTGQAQQVLREALAALAVARQQAGAKLDNGDLLEATLLANLAWLDDGDAATAVGLFEQAMAAFERVPELDARGLAIRATTAARYAGALTRVDRVDDAARVLGETTAAMSLGMANPSKELRDISAQLAEQTAKVERRLGHAEAAVAAQRRANALYHDLAAEHPGVPGYADNEAAGLHFLAQMQLDAAEPALAVESLRAAVATRERLATDHPQDHRQRARLARSLLMEANAEVDLWQHHRGDRLAAEKTLARAATIADELVANHGDDLESLLVFAGSHTGIGALHMGAGEFKAALVEFTTVRERLTAGLTQYPNEVEIYELLASTAGNVLKVQYQLGDFAAAAAAGKDGLEQVAKGMKVDARYPTLLETAAELGSLTATALSKNDDVVGAVATLFAMCETAANNPAARELACLLLENVTQDATQPEHDEWLQRAVRETQAAIAARGSLDAAIQRPAQDGGFSLHGSRLRDFDLRLCLAEMLRNLGESAQQATVLDEAEQLAATLPHLAGDRLRNLCDQRAVLQLAADDPVAAEATIEALLKRIGEGGGGNYLAAVLLTRCCDATKTPAEKDRLAERAVACLRLSLEHQEVDPRAIRHPNFAPLRRCGAYLTLLGN